MWWGWRAQEDLELTAAVKKTKRNAHARQIAHGVAERASQEQQPQQPQQPQPQQQQQRGTRGFRCGYIVC